MSVLKATHLTKGRWIATNLSLIIILAITLVAALGIGSESVGVSQIFGDDSRAHAILFASRLPRILLAALVGMALASSGGAFQALLRNPLADPFILGVSGGAALGSVLAVGFKLPFVWIAGLAFLGAAISMLVIFTIARNRGRLESTTLLLTGVIFNAFCFALILFVNSIVTMEEAYQILFMLIGNLEAIDLATVGIVAIFVLSGFGVLTALAWKMNLLSLGDMDAKSLGVNIERLKATVFIAASLMVGAAVAASGLIGFVGLAVPHMVRLLFGADNRLLIPASGLLGASFLVWADTAARTVLMNTDYATQLPVGVITAMIGAPLFILLLKGQKGAG